MSKSFGYFDRYSNKCRRKFRKFKRSAFCEYFQFGVKVVRCLDVVPNARWRRTITLRQTRNRITGKD